MALLVEGKTIERTKASERIDSKNIHYDFICKVRSALSYDSYCIFKSGNVHILEYNNELIFLWQDAKGNACYKFRIEDKEYFTTSTTKLSNALSGHFRFAIEANNNVNESLSKQIIATKGLSKALADSKKHDDYSAYSRNYTDVEVLKGHDDFAQNYSEEHLLGELDTAKSTNQQVIEYQPAMNQQYPHMPNPEQLHKEIIGLSTNQLGYNKQIQSLSVNQFPVVPDEEFGPDRKLAFYIAKNGLIKRNSYIPTKFMTELISNYDVNNSFIMLLIAFMVKNDLTQAMNIFGWFANAFNLLEKIPLALVLHSEDDTFIKLFYEEIIVPLFNHDHCEKIDNDKLDKKSLSSQLDETVIINFHNILTPTLLNAPAKELTKRLIYKDAYKLNTKVITTTANILITSTSKYIPLIAKDVPSVLVEVESDLEAFCKDRNINNDYYEVAKLIENDLSNFSSIARSINLNILNNMLCLKYYDGSNVEIMDGDVDVLYVFNSSIKNRDKVVFKRLEIIAPNLYRTLTDDFDKGRVDRKNLLKYFSAIFGEDIYTSNRTLIADLRELSNTEEPFENWKPTQSGPTVYYDLH
ncbi:hypothetical protein KKH82_01060 [Patescibacteria group bacterium]|nr:hypothetical protein [Patescibacteria group bacterium]